MSRNKRQEKSTQLANLLNIAQQEGEDGIKRIAAENLNYGAERDELARRQAAWLAGGDGVETRIAAETLDAGPPRNIPAMDLNADTKARTLAERQKEWASQRTANPPRIAAEVLSGGSPKKIQAQEVKASSILERLAEKILSPRQINNLFGDPAKPAPAVMPSSPEPRGGFKAFIMSTALAEEIRRLMGMDEPAPQMTQAPKPSALKGQMAALLNQSNSFKATIDHSQRKPTYMVVPINSDGAPAPSAAAKSMSKEQYDGFIERANEQGARLEEYKVSQSGSSLTVTHGGEYRSDLDGAPYTRNILNGTMISQKWKSASDGRDVPPALVYASFDQDGLDRYNRSVGIALDSPAMKERPRSLHQFDFIGMVSGAAGVSINRIESPVDGAEPHYEVTVKCPPNNKGKEYPDVRIGIYPENVAMDINELMSKTKVPTSMDGVARTVELDDQEIDLIKGYGM